MATSAVKAFFNTSHSTLQQELQAWLAKQASQIVIRNVSMDSNDYGHCLAVLYEPGPGPVYCGLIAFNRRHDGAAEEATALLEQQDAEFALIAVGSNQHGHCLCLIGRVPHS